MRVISQDGRYNLPYETSVFFLSVAKDCTKIMAYAPHSFTMARYSNESIAKKAMERLIQAGTQHCEKSTFLNEMEM